MLIVTTLTTIIVTKKKRMSIGNIPCWNTRDRCHCISRLQECLNRGVRHLLVRSRIRNVFIVQYLAPETLFELGHEIRRSVFFLLRGLFTITYLWVCSCLPPAVVVTVEYLLHIYFFKNAEKSLSCPSPV